MQSASLMARKRIRLALAPAGRGARLFIRLAGRARRPTGHQSNIGQRSHPSNRLHSARRGSARALAKWPEIELIELANQLLS